MRSRGFRAGLWTAMARLRLRAWLSKENVLRQPWIILVPITLLISLCGIRGASLWDFHEPYVGGIVREMTHGGGWVVPTLNGQPYLEKPPLFYVLSSLCCRLGGSFSPGLLRLPSALLNVLTSLWIAWVGKRLYGTKIALWAGLLTATSFLVWAYGHLATVDMTLTAAVTLGLGSGAILVRLPAPKWHWTALCWTGCTLAFFAKGPIGPLLVLIPWVALMLLDRHLRLAARLLFPLWIPLTAMFLALGWFALIYAQGGHDLLEDALLRNSLGRFLGKASLTPMTGRSAEHAQPFYFYFLKVPLNLLPWTPLLAASLMTFRKLRLGTRSLRLHFSALAFAAGVLFLTLSDSKRVVYVLPLIPILCLHTAHGMVNETWRRRIPVILCHILLLILSATLLMLGLHQGWFTLSSAAIFGGGLGLGICLGLSTWKMGRMLESLGWGVMVWCSIIFIFLGFGKPALDTQWQTVTDSIYLAKDLESKGVHVFGVGLTETQLGHASLIRQSHLEMLSPASARVQLQEANAIALLVEPTHTWKEELKPLEPFKTIQTRASNDPEYARRTPVLVLNVAAFQILHPEKQMASHLVLQSNDQAFH